MQRIYLILICLVCATAVIAQPIRSNSFAQKMEAAHEAESAFNFAGALDWYEKAYDDMRSSRSSDKGPKNAIALKIAENSLKIRDYEKAAKTYKRILEKDEEGRYSEYLYNYAMCQKALAKYDTAVKTFEQFIANSDAPEMIAEAQFQIDGILTLRGMEPNLETSVSVVDLDLKTGSAEYSPRENPEDGNLYLGSLNRNKRIEVADEVADFHAKLYVAEKNKEGKFDKVDALGKTINREGFHSPNVAFTRDGKMMYFTRVQTEGTEIVSSNIMVSYKKDEAWSAPIPADGVNGDWDSKQPAAGQLFGKDVLFFASDMPGGQGGMDIYYANVLGEGEFSTPVNLGKTINTAKDDLAPFYHDGTLYYSTDGKPTIGGFDIFYTVWDGSDWSSAENLGFQFNTSFDDLYFSMNGDGKSGYFVSNRPTEGKKRLESKTCCDDIFSFTIKEVVIDLLATVVDGSEAPLPGATVTLTNITDPISNPKDIKYNALGNEFNFGLDADYKYKALITLDGYYPDSIEFNTAGILDSYTVEKLVTLRPMPKAPAEPEYITETFTRNEAIRLNKIYYDLDDAKILPDAEEDLSKLLGLMDKYPDMVIELSSHTDSQGTSRYNEGLSQRRAESATNWLLERGVDAARIKPVGYGESVILNRCVNGVRCPDDEHRFNRRTEFKIIAGPQTIEIQTEKKVIKK